MGMIEKHELTLSFNTSEEMWQFVNETHTIDKIVGVEDYKHWIKENEDGTENADQGYKS